MSALVTVGDQADDITCLVDLVTIQHGRQSSSGQPDASACTLDLSSAADGSFALPASLEMGAPLFVYVDDVPRFGGNVTDLTLSWEDAGEATPDRPIGQVVATGVLDQLARIPVGGGVWDQQLDGARVAELVAEAGFGGLDPAKNDPGTVQIVSQELDEQVIALDACRDVADSASGIMWESRDGEFRYADANHRSGAGFALSLDACDLLVTPQWRRTLDGLTNRAVVGYGDPSGPQVQATSVNATSEARYGPRGVSVTTLLATLADAQAMASLLTTRGGSPVWIMAALPVDVAGLDPARYAALLGLDMHALINLTGLPAAGSAPTSAALWVEGWTETIGASQHDLALYVSGYCRTVPAPRWDDVDPGWTWDNMDPTLTWDGATCFGPPVQLGRWLDVPATLRWNQVPPAVTWDTWNAYIGAPAA